MDENHEICCEIRHIIMMIVNESCKNIIRQKSIESLG